MHAPHVEEAQSPTGTRLEFQLEISYGVTPIDSRKFSLPPSFLANFGVVRPPFTVRPLVLEWSFNTLQNHTHLDGRIISVEKSITIHTVPSTAFSSEPGKFREVRPSQPVLKSRLLFWCRSTSFHGETTCFGMVFQHSTKPYPS